MVLGMHAAARLCALALVSLLSMSCGPKSPTLSLAVELDGTVQDSIDLPRLAELHSRSQLDIRPELYDQWLDCLVEAAGRHDPSFSPGVERAWRETLAVGIALMRSRY